MWEKVSLILWVNITIADVENSGTYNHLLETRKGPGRQYSISYSSPEPLTYKYGEWFRIKMEGECQEVWKLDEVPKGMEEAFPFGVPRKAYICNIDELEILK